MMPHDFRYHDYEFSQYPTERPLPVLSPAQAAAQERAWLAMQAHPIKDTIQYLQVMYERYPLSRDLPDNLELLQRVAYGAHPLFGAYATRRIAGFIRISHRPVDEFWAMTLASDSFADYPFTWSLAVECADHAAECASLAGQDDDVIAAWRTRAQRLHAAWKQLIGYGRLRPEETD
ncbi:MAG: hypothetical protein ACO3IG_06515 [Opitutales bacterium]